MTAETAQCPSPGVTTGRMSRSRSAVTVRARALRASVTPVPWRPAARVTPPGTRLDRANVTARDLRAGVQSERYKKRGCRQYSPVFNSKSYLSSYLRQGGYVFVVVCLSVCLSVFLFATLRKNSRTDLHEFFREGCRWASEQMIKIWWRSESPLQGLFSRFVTIGRYATLQCWADIAMATSL